MCLVLAPRKKSNQLRLPSFPGICEVESSLRGRLRLRLPSILSNPEQAQACQKQLLSADAVLDCTFNPRIGTMLICFDPEQVDGAVVEGAVLRLMGLDAALEKEPQSKVMQGVKTLASAINHGVYETTGGLLDAKALAALGLTGAALRAYAAGGFALPGAATLLWWASSLWGRNDQC